MIFQNKNLILAFLHKNPHNPKKANCLISIPRINSYNNSVYSKMNNEYLLPKKKNYTPKKTITGLINFMRSKSKKTYSFTNDYQSQSHTKFSENKLNN